MSSIGGISVRDCVVVEKSECGVYHRCGKTIGRGSFKAVHVGFDLSRKTAIAWHRVCSDDLGDLKQLRSEAALMMSLEHENIVECYKFWIDEEKMTANMITKLFFYGTLGDQVRACGGVDTATIKNWGRQILEGVNFLHKKSPKIVHRDLKCDNIFRNVETGEIKIGDFGLAETMLDDATIPLRAVVGTHGFIAPEVYEEEYNELVDVFAFGMCVLEMATGDYPYSECGGSAEIYRKVMTGVKPPSLGRVDDPQVKNIIEICLVRAAEGRPSAEELLKHPFFSRVTEDPIDVSDSGSRRRRGRAGHSGRLKKRLKATN